MVVMHPALQLEVLYKAKTAASYRLDLGLVQSFWFLQGKSIRVEPYYMKQRSMSTSALRETSCEKRHGNECSTQFNIS